MEPITDGVRNELIQLANKLDIPNITTRWIIKNITYKAFYKQLYELSEDQKFDVLRLVVNQKLIKLYGENAPKFVPTKQMIAKLEVHYFYQSNRFFMRKGLR